MSDALAGRRGFDLEDDRPSRGETGEDTASRVLQTVLIPVAGARQ